MNQKNLSQKRTAWRVLAAAPVIPKGVTNMRYCFSGCEKLKNAAKMGTTPEKFAAMTP